MPAFQFRQSIQRPLNLLVVEDSDQDYETFVRLLNRNSSFNYPIYRCSDGEEALDYLFHQGEYAQTTAPTPAVILLDLNLPGTDGREVIRELKHHEQLKKIPIVVFTTSDNPQDVDICYRNGVNCYMTKPMGIEALKQTIHKFVSYWFEEVVLPTV